jgi:hypothetical protein
LVATTAQGEGLRNEVFDKVERVFLLGLRAADPAMRRRFFGLYDSAIPPTLFDRLRFIVCGQEWEHLADTFWLKQGLVRGSACSGPALPLPTCSLLSHVPLIRCSEVGRIGTNLIVGADGEEHREQR